MEKEDSKEVIHLSRKKTKRTPSLQRALLLVFISKESDAKKISAETH